MTFIGSSVELAPRRVAVGSLARFGSFSRFREIAPLLAPRDAFVRPQSFQNELRGGSHVRGVLIGLNVEGAEQVEQARNGAQLRAVLGRRRSGGDFQVSAAFEELHQRLKIGVSEV